MKKIRPSPRARPLPTMLTLIGLRAPEATHAIGDRPAVRIVRRYGDEARASARVYERQEDRGTVRRPQPIAQGVLIEVRQERAHEVAGQLDDTFGPDDASRHVDEGEAHLCARRRSCCSLR